MKKKYNTWPALIYFLVFLFSQIISFSGGFAVGYFYFFIFNGAA